MERPKHRRFIFLGLVLLAVGVLLLGRQWFFSSTEPAPAPEAVVAEPQVQTQPDEVELPAVAAASASTPATASVAPAATTCGLCGKVIDAATRRPVEEFEVRMMRMWQEGDVHRQDEPITRTFRGKTGRFAWHDISPSTWWVAVSAPGYQLFNLGELKIVAGATTREVVIPLLHGYAVRGRVFERSTGAGIGDAWIAFREASSWEDDNKWRADTKSKDDGSFVLDGVPGGSITLMVHSKGHGSRELQIVADDNTAPQEIALSTGGTIAGTVTTAAGTPVKARTMLFGPDAGHMDETSDAGQFSFKHLRPGRYDLATSGSGGAARQAIVLGEDERKEDIVLAFGPGRTVRGVVRGLRPEQLQRTWVGLQNRTRASTFLQARPDERGAYVFNGVTPGRAQFSVHAEGRRLLKEIDVPADQDIALDIVFQPGVRLSGRVTQSGQPAAHKMIWISPAEPRSGTHHHATTSADGQYEIEGIVPGEYGLLVDEDLRRPMSIAGDTVLNIDIPSVQLGGRVHEDGGSVPIVGADVYLRGTEPATTRIHNRKQTDDFGQFKLTGIEPGEIMLIVYKPGYELYREKIAYSSPISNKRISLRRGGVEVRVRSGANREPLRGIMLTEKILGNEWGIDLWIPLDREGVGSMPSTLAGSTLQVYGFGNKPIVIEEWDGQALELKL